MLHDFLPVLYDRCSHFGIKPRAIDRSPQCDQNVSVIKNTAKHNRIKTNFKLSRIIMKYNGVCYVPCIVFMNRENHSRETKRRKRNDRKININFNDRCGTRAWAAYEWLLWCGSVPSTRQRFTLEFSFLPFDDDGNGNVDPNALECLRLHYLL